MKLRDVFIITEAGPFRVIPGGKPSGEPSDPQGYLYSADEQLGPKEKLQTAVRYVIENLKEFQTKLDGASDDQVYSIALDMMDTASDLNWALKAALEEE